MPVEAANIRRGAAAGEISAAVAAMAHADLLDLLARVPGHPVSSRRHSQWPNWSPRRYRWTLV
jgi:hypothetical protein